MQEIEDEDMVVLGLCALMTSIVCALDMQQAHDG
jgi:2-phospho-L-lactate transferase/gluconeogenesis factor (CofD/UPF0052 family)